MTVEEIIDVASKRFNPYYQSNGMLVRQDIFDFLSTLPEGADKKAEVIKFIDMCTFLPLLDKDRLMKDLTSYGI